MKLRNKKTGEIGELHFEADKEYHFTVATEDPADMRIYKTVAELNEDWEDAPEEPKEYWFIAGRGDVEKSLDRGDMYDVKHRKMGNYFETKEEAEKAVEKLEALTEAKKDGLVIKGYYYNHEDLVILADIGNCNKLTLDTLFGKDLDLLFGGEE